LSQYLNNSDGLYTKVTHPRGFVTRTWHQAFDAPGSGAPVAIQHPEGTYTDIVRDVFGKPKSNDTGFLRAEQNLLDNHGWTYDPASTMWQPPAP